LPAALPRFRLPSPAKPVSSTQAAGTTVLPLNYTCTGLRLSRPEPSVPETGPARALFRSARQASHSTSRPQPRRPNCALPWDVAASSMRCCFPVCWELFSPERPRTRARACSSLIVVLSLSTLWLVPAVATAAAARKIPARPPAPTDSCECHHGRPTGGTCAHRHIHSERHRNQLTKPMAALASRSRFISSEIFFAAPKCFSFLSPILFASCSFSPVLPMIAMCRLRLPCPPTRTPRVSSCVYVARQPIFDRDKKVFGYELLFRDDMDNAFITSIPTLLPLHPR